MARAFAKKAEQDNGIKEEFGCWRPVGESNKRTNILFLLRDFRGAPAQPYQPPYRMARGICRSL